MHLHSNMVLLLLFNRSSNNYKKINLHSNMVLLLPKERFNADTLYPAFTFQYGATSTR